jgi:moderate conductance mechanosensitive channel
VLDRPLASRRCLPDGATAADDATGSLPMSWTTLLAQTENVLDGSTETDVSDVLTPREAGPIEEWIEQAFGEGPVVSLIAASVDVIGQILLLLVIGLLVLWLARRGIRRAVASAKDPSAPRGRRLRRRVGLSPPAPAPSSERRSQRADALGALATSIVSVAIWTVLVTMILGVFGINLGPLIAGAGIIGIAIGFGAQDLVKDFLSGVFMLLEDQYGVGDIVDAGDAAGVVEGVTLRSTRIRDVTGTLWHIPNGEIRRIGNMSQEWARALLDIGVAYGTDIDVASQVISRVATDMAHEEDYQELFLDEPEIWGVENLGTDSVDIRLVIKTQPGQQYAIARELRRRIKRAFDTAEVEIPFPQRTVWLRTEQPVALGGADARPFGHPVPDEPTIQHAVEDSRRGDTGATSGFDELLPDEPEAGPTLEGSDDAGTSAEGETRG